MKFKRYIFLLICCIIPVASVGQINYGTTGLLNMPTADMQKDKTFFIGANYLNKHTTVPRWWYNTYNYYLNITIFPWLEVGYMCALHKSVPTDYGNISGYWVPSTYGKFVNQDRSFHMRLRIWKEGWWKPWMPQIAFNANEAIGNSSGGGKLFNMSEGNYSNGFWIRYALAFTKHFEWNKTGRLGVHLSWIYSNRFDNKLNDPAIGVDFQPTLDNSSAIRKIINQLKLMVEVLPGYTDVNSDLTFNPNQNKYQVNVGVVGSIWRDNINAVIELDKMKYVSLGLQCKIHLK